MPDELVIAVMQDEPYTLPETDFPVRQVMLGSNGIPLAEARNRAAGEATGDLLVSWMWIAYRILPSSTTMPETLNS